MITKLSASFHQPDVKFRATKNQTVKIKFSHVLTGLCNEMTNFLKDEKQNIAYSKICIPIYQFTLPYRFQFILCNNLF